MKTVTTNRIQDAFRAGKMIDSAIKRAADFAKKTAGTNTSSVKKSAAREIKTTK